MFFHAVIISSVAFAVYSVIIYQEVVSNFCSLLRIYLVYYITYQMHACTRVCV